MTISQASGNILKITWQRLISGGETCPRCGSTEKEFDTAVLVLRQALAHIGIDVLSAKEELSLEEFRRDPLHSNRIRINNVLLDEWLGGKTGQSPCCNVCGPSECRTVTVRGRTYEVIPAELIIKAGFAAASQMTFTMEKHGKDVSD